MKKNDPKSKQEGEISGVEANPEAIDKSVAPVTGEISGDAVVSEENASGKGEKEEEGEKEKESKEVEEEMETRREGEWAMQVVERNGTASHADSAEHGEQEGMPPLNYHFPSTQYQYSLKLSSKCYIDTCITNIEAVLKKKEMDWFIEHPQFKHFFHLKNRKQKWMGMWLLVLRSACVKKKYELWFIVNGVPIRYSLRELGLISGLYCHEYPPNHERLGGKAFVNKYFGTKRVTYAVLEKEMLAMKSKPSEDRKKMAALYFLASILVGGRKSGEGASPVDSFFLNVVDDLDVCLNFPWGRYAFEHNLKDVSSFLDKSKGVAPTSWVFTSFPIPLELLAFEAIPSLRNHFRENVVGARPECPRMCKMQYKRKSGTREYSLKAINDQLGNEPKDIESILVAKPGERELLETIGMDKESCWADDDDDPAVDGWTKDLLQKGLTQVFFEEQFCMDCEARTAEVKARTNPPGGSLNNAQSGQAHADSVDATGAGAKDLKALEARLMKAVRDEVASLKESNKQQSEKIARLEEKVKKLSPSEEEDDETKSSDEQNDETKSSDEQNDETKSSDQQDDETNSNDEEDDKSKSSDEEEEDDEGDKETNEEDDEGDKETNEEDDEGEKESNEEDDVGEKESKESEEEDDYLVDVTVDNARKEKTKKRVRIDDGIEAGALKKVKPMTPAFTRSAAMKAAASAAAEKEVGTGNKATGKEATRNKAAGNKAAGKKAAGKKAAGKKAAGNKAAGNKAAGNKAAAEKELGKKPAVENAPPKKKPAVENAPPKKPTAEKAQQKKRKTKKNIKKRE